MVTERQATSALDFDGWYGRLRERERLEAWLANPLPPTEIWTIAGVAGSGKSTVLRAIWSLARQKGVSALLVDLHRVPATPAHFLESIQQGWIRDQGGSAAIGPDAVLEWMHRDSRSNPVILCIDSFESLSLMEEWFHQGFVANLPEQGVLVCVASRTGISSDRQRDFQRVGWYRTTELTGWTWDECRQMLAQYGMDHPTVAASVFRETGGLPLGIILCAAYLRQYPQRMEERLSLVAHKVSAELLRDVTAVDLHPFVDALVVAHRADQHLLSVITGTVCSTPRFHALSDLSFVWPSLSGLAVHETARSILLSDFLRRNPTQFFQYHQRALQEILRLRRHGYGSRKDEYGLQLLSLCADVCAALTYPGTERPATWQTLPDVGKLNPEEAPDIEAIFARKVGHVGHTGVAYEELTTLVARVAHEVPDMVRVVRSTTGDPLGFSISLALGATTIDMLPTREQRAVLKALGPEFEPEGTLGNIHLMAAGWIVPDHPDLPAPILWTALLIDWLLTLGEGQLGLALGYEPETEAYFAQLGFKPRGLRAADLARGEDDVGVFALDFRDRGLDDWVYHVIQQSYPFSMHHPTVVASPQMVRDALKCLGSPARMATSALAEKNQWSGEFAMAQLVGMISGQIATDLTFEEKHLLNVTFIQAGPHYTVAMDTLHMSRSSYYRHLEEAIERFTLALTRMPIENAKIYP